jgi:hypothetical protein
MRLSEKRTQYLRENMPYGIWTMPDGAIVLFNRQYQPIWYKQKGKPAVEMERSQWVNWEIQIHLFRDGNSPWKNRNTLKILTDLLENFGIETEVKEWSI